MFTIHLLHAEFELELKRRSCLPLNVFQKMDFEVLRSGSTWYRCPCGHPSVTIHPTVSAAAVARFFVSSAAVVLHSVEAAAHSVAVWHMRGFHSHTHHGEGEQ